MLPKSLFFVLFMCLPWNVTLSLSDYSSTAQSELEPQSGVFEVAWSPDGMYLATANPDANVHLYDPEGLPIAVFQGHPLEVFSIDWSPDGRFLASGSFNDSSIRIWDIPNRVLSREIDSQSFHYGVFLVRWSPDGSKLAASGFDTFQVWDTISWSPINDVTDGTFYDMEWSPDGSRLAVSTLYDLRINASSDFRTGQIIDRAGYNPYAIAWSPDGMFLATSDRLDPGIYVWDASSSTLHASFLQTSATITDLTFINDDEIAAVSQDGSVYLIDRNGGLISSSSLQSTELRSVAWNPQAELIAVGGVANEISGESNLQVQTGGFLQLSSLDALVGTP